MTQETKEWYERAVMDFGVAKHLEETYYPKPIEIICYHCQQSAEKAIKTLILYHWKKIYGQLSEKGNLSEVTEYGLRKEEYPAVGKVFLFWAYLPQQISGQNQELELRNERKRTNVLKALYKF